ncbi:hypothetical protein [Clostridium sp.]|uniref:hypothetical protein n=1 Tax=Clostridium sp. TaxID=1506 RepID=UPI00261860B9|nr:hypothetical protein [Clostridium sp.]
MNKKIIYTLSLLLILMLTISGMKHLFIEDIKQVAISNNVEGFNDYLLDLGRNKLTLPIGWSLKENPYNIEKTDVTFNNGSNINGKIIIVDGELEDYIKKYNNLSSEVVNLEGSNYNWKVVYKKEEENVTKYYLTQYSEGKVLIIEYSYDKRSIKNSMEIVFDKISDSFE